MTTSIDPTTTSAWSALSAHHKALTPNLREWFAADPARAEVPASPLTSCTLTFPRT